jgi:hypothetical protein
MVSPRRKPSRLIFLFLLRLYGETPQNGFIGDPRVRTLLDAEKSCAANGERHPMERCPPNVGLQRLMETGLRSHIPPKIGRSTRPRRS